MRELIDEMLLLAALDRGQAALAEGDCDAGAVAAVVVERAVRGAPGAAGRCGSTPRAGLRVPIARRGCSRS